MWERGIRQGGRDLGITNLSETACHSTLHHMHITQLNLPSLHSTICACIHMHTHTLTYDHFQYILIEHQHSWKHHPVRGKREQ